MRVLIVHKFAHVSSGSDQYCLTLTRELERHGHEVRWISTCHPGNQPVRGEFVPLTAAHATRDQLGRVRQAHVAAAAIWSLHAASATRHTLSAWRPDVIHVNKLYPQLSVAPVVVARQRRVPVVQTLHDYELLSADMLSPAISWRDSVEKRFAYIALNSATLGIRRFVQRPLIDRFLSVSHFVANVYRKFGIESEVVHNAVPAPLEQSASFGGRSGVLFVGRLAPNKGIHELLEVAALTPELPLTICGSGELDSLVSNAAARLPNLRWTGATLHEDVQMRMRRARIVVVPSRWDEPGALVPLEAMAAGTPVVASARGGLTEYVGETGAGVVVSDDGDEFVFNLARAVRELYNSSANWGRTSRAALAASATTYSLETWFSKTLTAYEATIAAYRS